MALTPVATRLGDEIIFRMLTIPLKEGQSQYNCPTESLGSLNEQMRMRPR
jgi:hypothetical protein